MKSRNLLLAHTALFAAAGVTPSFAAPPSSPLGSYNWAGPYIGYGGVWLGRSDQTDLDCALLRPPPPPPPLPPPPPRAAADGSYLVGGGFIGGTAGYNWQAGPWVLGVEGDYSWANINGSSTTCGVAPPHGCGTTLQSFGTLRGCVGYGDGARRELAAIHNGRARCG